MQQETDCIVGFGIFQERDFPLPVFAGTDDAVESFAGAELLHGHDGGRSGLRHLGPLREAVEFSRVSTDIAEIVGEDSAESPDGDTAGIVIVVFVVATGDQ